MSLGIDLRTKLLSDSTLAGLVGERVMQGKIAQGESDPCIWYGRAGIDPEDSRTLDQAPGERPFREQWDLEVYADSLDLLDAVADRIRLLDCYRGPFGDGSVQAVFVFDHTEDYLPRGDGSDNGRDGAFFRLEIVGYTNG